MINRKNPHSVPGISDLDSTGAGTHSRRDFLRLGLATAAAGLIASPALAARSKVKRIRYAHSTPTTHGWHLWGERFKKVIEEKSAGTIEVTIFPNAQMGTERDIAQAVRIGSLEMASVGVALMNWVPEFSITDAPFLFRDRTQCYAALDGKMGAELGRLSSAQGFRLVGWSDLGSRSMTNNKHPINSSKDLAGLKMRVPDSKSYVAMMQAMGASIITIDLSELYLALSQGVADGQETPLPVVNSNKLFEVQKYLSKTDHVLTTSYAIVNPATFDGLSADEQKIFLEASADATNYLREYTQNDEQKAIALLKSKGMEVNASPDVASFREACAGVIEKFPELFRPDLVKLARSA
jgi:tripartite ATP-independent transporter DctP family solute receptor